MSWGNHLRRFGDKTPLDEPFVLSARVSRQNNAKHYRHYFDCDFLKCAESKLNPCVSTNLETRPLRGAKNRNQASSSASADFLLEAEKRGSPPKSEKAAAFWETHLNVVGGSGNRGVQPFLRKKISEIDSEQSDKFTESARDSARFAQNRRI